jgi:myo-inositol-1(or 4)-monophosphatase
MARNTKKFLNFSNTLADEARLISLRYFKKKISIENKKKNGFDPVTVADIKIQKKLNRLILKSFPDHSIIGEEETYSKNSSYEWCIDPIDGTKSFIQGMPLWGTLISLSENGNIILGLADIPALDERYIGYEKKSYKIINGKKTNLKVRNNKEISDSILNTTSPYLFANKNDQSSFERLSKMVKLTRLGGDCYSYCLLADGHVDIVVESGLNPWDIRALEPIIVNAGGVLKTWDNKKIFNGGSVIACANNKIFNQCRTILNKKNPPKNKTKMGLI